jgi:hypothetical protein
VRDGFIVGGSGRDRCDGGPPGANRRRYVTDHDVCKHDVERPVACRYLGRKRAGRR